MDVDDSLKLERAAFEDDWKTVKYLIEEKHVPDKGMKTARIAAEKGNLPMLRYFIELTVERNMTGWDLHNFESLITHTAIESNHFPIVKYFIEERKVDVEILNEFREPPMFTALRCQRHDIFKYLVEERHANITALDSRRNNILYVAAKNDDVDTIRQLLDEKKIPFDLNHKNENGDTLLHMAVMAKGIEQYDNQYFNWRETIPTIEYLVNEKQANVNAVNKHLKTPLHQAALLSHLKICNLLMDHGASTQMRDAGGHNYWELCSLRKRRIRSVDQPPFRVEDEWTVMPYSWTVRSVDDGNASHVGNSVVVESGIALPLNNFLSQFNVSYFAAIARLLLFKSFWRLPQVLVIDRFTVPSPSDILREKMDPIAINVVHGDGAYFMDIRDRKID